jgi:ABC-type branched-subunit amino acid transport system substrate-binding protein
MKSAIRIGGLGPLSSPGLFWAGRDLQDGMTLAVQHLNAAGEIAGKSIALHFEDTRGRTTAGIAAVEKLRNEGVDAFAGEYHSFVAIAFLDRIQQSGLPFVCASCTLDSITERRLSRVFRLAPPQSYGWRVYADFLAGEHLRHVVALEEETQYWNRGSKVIELRLKELGIRFTRFSVAPGTADAHWTTQRLQSIASQTDRPDMLLLLLSDEGAVRRALEKAPSFGLQPPSCFFGDPAGRTGFPGWWQTLQVVSAEVPFLSYMRWGGLTQIGRQMVQEFEKHYGRQPTFVALEGYDSVVALARAFAKAENTDPERVCDALRYLHVEGTRGTIKFSTEQKGVVHQQWKWPPALVMTYRRIPQQFSEAEPLWDSLTGSVSETVHLRTPPQSFSFQRG